MTQSKQNDKILRVSSTRNSFGAAKPGRAGPFQHANLDVVTPPSGHAIFRVQKNGPGNQLRRAWCLDARDDARVVRKSLDFHDRLFQPGIAGE